MTPQPAHTVKTLESNVLVRTYICVYSEFGLISHNLLCKICDGYDDEHDPLILVQFIDAGKL